MLSRAKRASSAEVTRPFMWPEDLGANANEPLADVRVPAARAVQAPDEPSEDRAAPRVSVAELEREGFANGYAQGEKAGFEAGAHRADAMVRRLAATIDEVSKLRRSMIAEAEEEMVKLALAIARRIVQREVTIDKDLVVTIARIALERLGGNTTATIRLNPDDYAAVVAQHGEAWAGVRVNVVADDGISRGGCKVESDVGLIDGSIDAQFARIASELIGGAETVDVQDGEFAADGVV